MKTNSKKKANFIKSEETRAALIVAVLVEIADAAGIIRYDTKNLIRIFNERNVFNCRQNNIAFGREIANLEKKGILRKHYRVNTDSKEHFRLGLHYFYRLSNKVKIHDYFQILPKIQSEAFLEDRLHLLNFTELGIYLTSEEAVNGLDNE